MRKRWGVEGGSVNDLANKTSSGRKKTYQNALRMEPNSRARNGPRAPPCGDDVETGRKITKKIPLGKLNQTPRTIFKRQYPSKKQLMKKKKRKNGSKYSRAVVASTSISHVRASRFMYVALNLASN